MTWPPGSTQANTEVQVIGQYLDASIGSIEVAHFQRDFFFEFRVDKSG